MNTLTRCLSLLQLSPRSQRVLTEALLDWRHEVASAPTVSARLVAHVRSTAAVCRLVLSLSAASCFDLVRGGSALRFGVWLVGVSAVLTLPSLPWPVLHGEYPSPSRLLENFAASVLGSAWIAAFYCVSMAPKSTRPPRVGIVLIASAVVVGAAVWFFPWAVALSAQWSHLGLPPGMATYTAYSPAQYALHFLFIISSVLLADAMRNYSTPSWWVFTFPVVLTMGFGFVAHTIVLALFRAFGSVAPPRLSAAILVLIVIGYWLVLVRRQELRRVPA